MFIYKITNIKNGKIYIGKTSKLNPLDRFAKHLDGLKYKYHPNKHLTSAFHKYGESSFVFEVIEETNDSLINERECFYIDLLKTANPKYGYNKTNGGEGQKATDETKAKISASNKGRKHSDKSRENMSKAHKGQIPWNKGKKFAKPKPERSKWFSDEHRKKLSLAKLGKPSHKKGIKMPGFSNSGSFKKGNTPVNKGKKGPPMPDHVKKILKEKLAGRIFTESHRKKLKDAWIIRRAKKLNEQNRNNQILAFKS